MDLAWTFSQMFGIEKVMVHPCLSIALLLLCGLFTTQVNNSFRAGMYAKTVLDSTTFKLIMRNPAQVSSKDLTMIDVTIWKVCSPVLGIMLFIIVQTITCLLIKLFDMSGATQVTFLAIPYMLFWLFLLRKFLMTTSIAGYVPHPFFFVPKTQRAKVTKVVKEMLSPVTSPQKANGSREVTPVVSPVSTPKGSGVPFYTPN